MSWSDEIRHKAQEYIRARVEVDANGCWLWTRARRDTGYANSQFFDGVRREQLGHRLSYRAFKGEIPAGFQIDHVCRVRICVNPEHLRALSQSEHGSRWKLDRGANVCRHGHVGAMREYKGSWQCWTCIIERWQKYRQANRDEVNERTRRWYWRNPSKSREMARERERQKRRMHRYGRPNPNQGLLELLRCNDE